MAAMLFASLLAAGALGLGGQARRWPTPLPGVVLGFIIMLVTPGAFADTISLVQHVVAGIARLMALAGLDGTAASNAISASFGDSINAQFFLGNLLLVMGYVLSSSLLLGLLSLLSRMVVMRGLADRMAHFPRDIWTNGFLARATLVIAVGAWGILVMLAFWAALKDGGGSLDVTRIISNSAAGTVWGGTFVFMIELAGAFRPMRASLIKKEVLSPSEPEYDDRRVRQIFDAFDAATGEEGFPDLIQREPRGPVHPKATDREAFTSDNLRTRRVLDAITKAIRGRVPSSAIQAKLRELCRPLERFYAESAAESAILVFSDSVTTASYAVFVEMIMNELDVGGCVLVVCPDGQEQLVRNEIEAALKGAGALFMAETLVIGTPGVENQLYDVLITSETSLEHDLLDNIWGTRERELSRLSMILGVNIHLTDLPRLKMMMRRLAERTPFDDIRLVLALTDFAEPGRVATTIFLNSAKRPPLEVRLSTRSPESIYRLGLHDTERNRETMRKVIEKLQVENGGTISEQTRGELGELRDMAALVAVAAAIVGLPVVFHDPRGRRILPDAAGYSKTSPWSVATINVVNRMFAGDPTVGIRFNELSAESNIPIGTPSKFGRLVLVEETNNADLILVRPYDFLDNAPTIVVARAARCGRCGAEQREHVFVAKAHLVDSARPGIWST
jgi:hypothetical protein